MKHLITILLFALLPLQAIEWHDAAPFSDSGIKGAYIGYDKEVLFIAGGETSDGVTNTIHVYQKTKNGTLRYLGADRGEFPIPFAHGVSVASNRGLYCIGGSTLLGLTNQIYRLNWDKKKHRVIVTPQKPLPFALIGHTAAFVEDRIIVIGGIINGEELLPNRYILENNLNTRRTSKWILKGAIPGSERINAQSIACSDGLKPSLYLLGGEWRGQPIQEFWQYDPISQNCTELPMPPGGVQNRHLSVSGANDLILNGKNNVSFNTVTKNWAERDDLFGNTQDRSMLLWDKHLVLGPSANNSIVSIGSIEHPYSLNLVTILLLIFYITTMIGIGLYFMRKKETTFDYYKGGQKIPWWAAGISIYGTVLSSIYFVSIPAKTFASDWQYTVGEFCLILVAPIIIFAFLPFFRRLQLTSAYEYLELRYNLTVRLAGSLIFIVFAMLRVGIVLYLAALVLSISTTIPVPVCIIGVGALSILYTSLGGIEAVIWTDVIQVGIFMIAAVVCFVFIIYQTPLSFSEMLEMATSEDKLRIFNFDFSFTKPTFWVIILACISYDLTDYGINQENIQRYLTTDSEKGAASSLLFNVVLCGVGSLAFFSIGTALFIFYKTNPQGLNPMLPIVDGILPHYGSLNLPPLAAGILITGIFAAAMSSIDSGINSLATIISTDFVKRFNPSLSDEKEVSIAKWLTVMLGAVSVVYALTITKMTLICLLDHYDILTAMTLCSLTGVFLLGIFTTVAHSNGVIVGLILNCLFLFYIRFFTPLHFLMIMAISPVSSFILGFIFSAFISKGKKNLDYTFQNYVGAGKKKT